MKRLSNKYRQIPSDNLESQGPGTWIEIRRKLTLGNLSPVLQLAQFQDDPRLKSENPDDLNAALNELMSGMAAAIQPLVIGWNWTSDVEAELARQPSMSGERVTLHLAEPLPGDVVGLPLYLGQFPNQYVKLSVAEITPDGQTVTALGKLDRAYVPGEDYVIVGLQAPSAPDVWKRLGFEEIMWIVNAITDLFKLHMESEAGRPKAR
jgi:hypothetical protein